LPSLAGAADTSRKVPELCRFDDFISTELRRSLCHGRAVQEAIRM
jgi:hypothetical protein